MTRDEWNRTVDGYQVRFGARLRTARTFAHLTIPQVSDLTGIPVEGLTSLEDATGYDPTLDELRSLCKAIGMVPMLLLDADGVGSYEWRKEYGEGWGDPGVAEMAEEAI